MAHSQPGFPAMPTSRDVPNPLRPYYVPPSIGLDPAAPGSGASAANASMSASSRASLGNSARDILSELDYSSSFFDSDGPSVPEMGKKMLDQTVWKYTSILLAQPFDVAKTILQVRYAASAQQLGSSSASSSRSRSRTYLDKRQRHYGLDETETESEGDDEPSYFTSTNPQRGSSRYPSGDESPSRRRSRRRHPNLSPSPRRRQSSTPTQASYTNPHTLNLRRPDAVLEVLGQLWQQSGATALWKATNATFIYNVLLKAVESWTRSLLSALLNLPDPVALAGNPSDIVAGAMGGLDLADSPSPMASLAVAAAAAGIAGLLLAPLDLIRTRLILTPTSTPPRAILPSLRLLPTFTIPTSLIPVTLLHSSLPTLITSSTPLLLRQYLHIDPITSPANYSLSTFLASTTELFVKLPLETVLRRGQVAALQANHARAYSAAQHQSFRGTTASSPTLDTVVEPGPYRGVFGTMWFIAKEEGVRDAAAPAKAKSGTVQQQQQQQQQTKQCKGQGVAGLWRGWRVGMWGLIGVWGASALGSGGRTGGEF